MVTWKRAVSGEIGAQMTKSEGAMFNGIRRKLLGSGLWRRLRLVISILMVGASMSACAATSWKEEVLLHDGKKLLVERWETVDPSGFRELGQSSPRAEEGTRFVIPGTSQTVTWKSDFGRGQQDNLDLLVLNFLGDTPYIATQPAFCHAYNKWGRPNPPYVFFRFDGKVWQRIPLAEFPAEFKETNVMVNGYNEHQLSAAERASPFITAETVRKQNRDLSPHLRVIVRTQIKSADESCPKMVYDGSGGWLGIDWFTSQPSYEACLKVCARKNISDQYCPCGTLFKGK